MLNIHTSGVLVRVVALGQEDPCYQLAGAHVFGIRADGTLVRSLIVRLLSDAVPVAHNLFAIDGIQEVDNYSFGNFIGPYVIDPPDPGDESEFQKFMQRDLGAAEHLPPDDPFDARERHRSVAGDMVCFSHAVLKPYFRKI